MKKTLFPLVALGLALSSAPALAGSTNVVFADLDLSTAEGQARLEKRVDRAARALCNMDEKRVGTRIRHPETIACYKEAKAKAHAQVAALSEQSRKGG